MIHAPRHRVPLRSATSSGLALAVAAGLTVATPGTASASQFDDWTVTASAGSLNIAATSKSAGSRQSITITGMDKCVSYPNPDYRWSGEGSELPRFLEHCGEKYYVSDNISGDVSRDPSTNCFENASSNGYYCQRVNPLTVDAGSGDDWLYLTNIQGVGGYSVDAALGPGNDLVDISGPGAWSFDGGSGTDKVSLSRPYAADGERTSEGWIVDLGAQTATSTGTPDGGDVITDPVTIIDFEDVDTNGGAGGPDVVTGTEGPNWISTGPGDDVVDGLGDDDRINAWSGLDVVRGGDGDDSIQAGEGDDRLFGGPGDDRIEDFGPEASYPDGNRSDDEIFGGPGDDRISAGAGDDEIAGGPGADVIDCGDGEDTVTDAETIDTIAENCEHVSRGLEVELTPYDTEGEPIDGIFAPGQEILVKARLVNNTDSTLDDFSFGDARRLMTVDPRSPGGLRVLGQDQLLAPEGLTLTEGEARTVWYSLTATARGLAALNSEVTATDPDDEIEDAFASLRVDIEDGEVVDDVVGRWVMLQTVDRYLMKMYDDWLAALDQRARQLQRRLGKHLTNAQKKIYFGARRGLKISGGETLLAQLRMMSDASVAVPTPNRRFKGHSVEQLNGAYNDAFMDEVGKGVKKWASKYGAMGRKGKAALEDMYAESLLASFYMLGNATPQERMEFEAKMIAFADNNTTSKNSIINGIKREIPRWKENGTYLGEAIEMSAKDVTLQSPDLQAQLKQEAKWRENMLRNADRNPIRFQREWAKRDAEIFNLGGELILDTLLGGAVERVTPGLKAWGSTKVSGRGSSVLASGEAAGVITPKGKLVKGPRTGIADVDAPSGLTGGEASRTTEKFLSEVDGATLVQADDFGNVYELPNVGGVPEVTLDVKAGILKELETEYATARGQRLKLVEVLKPSSPYRKAGGVAKLELTEQKTGKLAMLDAGAPPAVLPEANVWRNTRHPSSQKGWGDMPKVRQDAALKEWNKANKNWENWLNPEPGSKTARLQQCIGQEARVPLDPKPNAAGLQRFVTAEFEVVDVSKGTAQAKLIRVKKYVVEVVDTKNGNKVVNGKTVVDEARAVPQTPDADAVAVGKHKLDAQGNPVYDAQGRPVVEPLSRAEREFVMQRYIDKNVKARRNGSMPDAAEHGATLVMDDASAKAAGKLLPAYGAPFLPGGVGRDYLRRIAPFVKPKGVSSDAMYRRMVNLVNSEGGFGQHAVVVTTESRYLGELAVAAW